MLFSQSPADPLGEATIGGTCASVQTFVPYKGFTESGPLDPHKQCYVLTKELFCKNGAILDFTHDTCEMRSLVTGSNWPRVISNHRKFVCSSKSVVLACLLLRKHFQILASYFLPHTNTVILLDSYCGIIKEAGLFLLGSQTLPRKCESKHWLLYGQVITKCVWNG